MIKIKRNQKVGLVILSIAATILVVKGGLFGKLDENSGLNELSERSVMSFFRSTPEVLTTHWTCWNPEAPEKFSRLRFVKDSDAHTGLVWFADAQGEETAQGTMVMRSSLESNDSESAPEDSSALAAVANKMGVESSERTYQKSAQINSRQAKLEVITQEQEKIFIQVNQRSLHSRARQGQITVSFEKLKGPDRSQTLKEQNYECRKFSEVRNLPASHSDTQVAQF